MATFARTTTTALLEDLGDPANQEVWEEFDARYRPILCAVGRRLGLSEEDAADAAQEALMRFVKGYRSGAYDRSRGSLRAWLIGITRNCVRDLQARQVRRAERHGPSGVAELPDEFRMTQLWDQQQRRVILEKALDELRASARLGATTLQAFEMIVLQRRPAPAVAEELGVSLNDVYLAKHRCLKRLRSLLARLERAYSLDSAPQERGAP